MDVILAFLVGVVYQADMLLMESRQMIGLLAAFLAAVLAARLGWHGTDRVLTCGAAPRRTDRPGAAPRRASRRWLRWAPRDWRGQGGSPPGSERWSGHRAPG